MKRTKVPKKELNLFENSMQNKILKELFKHPDLEYSLSDLAKAVGVSKSNIGAILNNLYEIGVIHITKLTKIWRIKANQENWHFTVSKIVFNLNYIYQSGLIEFINTFYNNPRAIILFGSFRWGKDISSSDIDIAIETAEDIPEGYQILSLRSLVKEKADSEKFIAKIEENISRKIQVHVFSKKSRKNIDINVFNSIANGIVFTGFLEVKP